MNSPGVMHHVKFLTTPSKVRRADELSWFEAKLLVELLSHYYEDHSFGSRVPVDGAAFRKASYFLVSKGLAAYVNGFIHPSAAFNERFVPLVESCDGDEFQRMFSAYEKYVLVR